jgi:hypothetical protein
MPRTEAKASAKLEAGATAKWSRKRLSIEYVPPDVTRANASAFRDLFSPLTEAAGFVGARIRHKRALWEMQREAESELTLRRIAQRFVESRTQQDAPGPPPSKFLYPFIAQASLEEPDSPLIDVWAHLLASATDHYDPRYVHFVSVVSRLSARQAEIFHEIVSRAGDSRGLELAMDDIKYVLEAEIRGYIEELFLGKIPRQFKMGARTIDRLFAVVEFALRTPIVSFVHGAAANEGTGDYYDITLDDCTLYTDEQEVDYAILEACGLLQRIETDMFPINEGSYSVRLTYYHLTTLGFSFALACKMVPMAPGWTGR